MEVLAPVGSKEGFQAVLKQKPDVIYLGAGDMNARSSEAQLSLEDLPQLVADARKQGVKIYFTLNILVKDSEFARALEIADLARQAGVSAFIVQDKGLMRLLHEHFPDIVLHASTQCSVGTREQIRELLALHVRRVVLARELSLEEIRDLSDYAHALGIEVEVFTHGATCMSVSGQCHMSFCIGGRSANRGSCAQPCRKSYSLLRDGKVVRERAAWLSPKDLSYFPYLKELAEIPVDALKIEGRLRSSEYQAQVTAIIKTALEEIAQGLPDQDIFTRDRQRNLEIAFNRGGSFQAAFLKKQRSADFLSPERVNHWGYFLGEVCRIKAPQGVLLYSPHENAYLPSAGSQISLKNEAGKTVASAPVGVVQRSSAVPKAGKSHEAEIELRGFHPRILASLHLPLTVWQQKQPNVPEEALRRDARMPLSLHLSKKGSAFILRLKSSDKELSFSSEELPSAPEETPGPLTLSRIEEQLAKLGDSPYVLSHFSTDLSPEEAPHWRISTINSFRRAALEKFLQVPETPSETSNDMPQDPGIEPEESLKVPGAHFPAASLSFSAAKTHPTPVKRILNFPNYLAGASLQGLSGKEDELIVLPLEELYLCAGKAETGGLKQLREDLGDSRLGAYLSPLGAWSCPGSPGEAISALAGQGLTALVSSTSGTAELKEELGLDLDLFLWQGGQVTNSKSYAYFAERGYRGVMLSPELTLQEQSDLAARFHDSPTRPIILCQGPFEAMFTRFCPIGFSQACGLCRKGAGYQLQDEEGRHFPLTPKLNADCSLQIWDSRSLLQQPSFDCIRAYTFLRESPAEIRNFLQQI
ncbi:MAG: U32 family peptidase [Clostridiales bacterium]|nr:U32 family peptidase [Clostridiales bacterium]MDD7433239.1 U32 family peptidase [Clostridiales bacterium]MDY3061327.1 U32 family peptidase [Eubacteriales bacterium]